MTDVLRAAVVGAGPSGFYATDQLLKQGFDVDLLEVLPTPFGLVRAGVAPDHPKIKSVTRVYEKTARREGVRFFGGVGLGGGRWRRRRLSPGTTAIRTRARRRSICRASGRWLSGTATSRSMWRGCWCWRPTSW